MSTPNIPTAGVIGAGIAGLCTAIALCRAGWDVQVLERSHLKNEIGAAITIMPPAVALLRSWGFDFDRARAVPDQRMTITHASHLTVLSHTEFADLKQQYGEEALTMHRADLHDGLKDLMRKTSSHTQQGSITLNLGCKVTVIDCDQGDLILDSGSIFKKDLLVVADGAHSQLFSQFTGQKDQICPVGRSLYRVLLQRSRIDGQSGTARFLDASPTHLPGMCCALDPTENTLLVTYPCREMSILNLAIVHDTARSAEEHPDAEKSWQAPASKVEVLNLLHNFHPDLQALFELADEDEIKIHHHMHRPPLQSFVRGKAVLVGDSAHLMLPTHAAGASMAIESAGVLEILMRPAGTPSSKFPPTPPKTSLDEEERPNGPVKPVRPPCSTSSSTRDLILGIDSARLHGSDSGKITDENDNLDKDTASSESPLIRALVARSLTLFDFLRVPRCTAFQLLSNGGFGSQGDPVTVERIRRHGFNGWLPSPSAGPWTEEFLKWYFEYDAVHAAERAIEELSR